MCDAANDNDDNTHDDDDKTPHKFLHDFMEVLTGEDLFKLQRRWKRKPKQDDGAA